MVNTIKSVRWFLTKDWHYINTNYLALTDHLNEHDRKLFPMSMKNMDWKSYIHTGYYGIRKFVLHEDDDNTKAAIGRLRRSVNLIVKLLIKKHYLSIKSH